VTRLREKQRSARENLDAVLDSTPLATVAFVRDGHPVALPIGFARLGDELVIHGSTGSPWLRHLADGAPASVAVTFLAESFWRAAVLSRHSTTEARSCSVVSKATTGR
jgi:nitroimidazol reductase NimA-like FMN-containing flavoprotein (pyridoxamine 5'-phosphate oxidase superfamily)